MPSTLGPRPLERRSLWLQEALPEEPGWDSPEPLSGSTRAGVCILGGGYAGLWTALFLKEREPSLDVALLEADVCGAGASGRNGGFALSWWAKLHALAAICGDEDALWLAREAEQAVLHIGSFCQEHGVEAHFVHGGWLWVAASQAEVGAWEETADEVAEHGSDAYVRLSPEETQRRGGSKAYLGGVLDRTAATVQPARLVRGLRRVALERGVRIYERTPALAIEGKTVRTPAGRVEADTIVAALNAWAVGLPEFRELRRAVEPLSSEMVASAPAPEILERIVWTGGECISDSKLRVHYHRTTRDGRIAIGRGGGALAFAGRFGDTFHESKARCDRVVESLHAFYPDFARVPVTHAWAGPIDRTTTGVPFFGRLRRNENVVYGIGFSGNGVGPCVVGGRILASLALRDGERWSSTRLSAGPPGVFPPEPIRFAGGIAVREAVRRKEALEDQGRRPGPLVRSVAGLAPAGLFKPGKKREA